MKKIDIGQLLQVLANVGVIGGLIFLAVEVQQSNRIARASTEIELKNSFNGMNEAVYSNPVLAELLDRLSEPDPILSSAESFQVLTYFLHAMNVWVANEMAFNNGMITRETYGTIEDDIRATLKGSPGSASTWRQILNDYPAYSGTDVFRTIERVLEEGDY